MNFRKFIAEEKIKTPYGIKKLDTSYEIPYLAGYSKNGEIIYIDKRLNPVLILKDGRKLIITKYLAIHESTEKYLMDVYDYKYQYAHIKATETERNAVEDAGYPWDEYQKYCLSEVHRLRSINRSAKIPKDLDIKPEIDTHDYPELNIIKHHQ